MNQIDVGELLHQALLSARLAARVIRDVRLQGNLGVLEKGDGSNTVPDPQTEADRRAEALIVAALREKFPDVKIVGEEGVTGGRSEDWEGWKSEVVNLPTFSKHLFPLEDVTVWVDPLDGTNDFVNMRLECVTTLIGITVGTVPVAAVIYRPFSDEALVGGSLFGVVYWNNEVIRPLLSKTTICHTSTDTLRLVTSKTRASSRTDTLIERLGKTVVTKVGGAGWKFWLILDGQADLYFYPKGGMKLWDICAGDVLLRAMGGVLTSPSGEEFKYHSDNLVVQDGLIATMPPLNHAQLLAHLTNFL